MLLTGDSQALLVVIQGTPYALFGTCLGAIVAYEVMRKVQADGSLPMPVQLFVAAVSPPHLYAVAVMKLYLNRPMAASEQPPLDEVMQTLSTWDKIPKDLLMQVSSA